MRTDAARPESPPVERGARVGHAHGVGEETGKQVVVVDGANVVGSVPDGWWRDRPGAAKRLHDRLVATDLGYAAVVLVLEGQARRGQPVGSVGPVRTVHAPREGDDEIVEQVRRYAAAGDHVVAVTADRALRERIVEAGGDVHGPSWLLDRLPA